MLHKVFYCGKLHNKQSAKVICWFDRLTKAHSNRQATIIMGIRNLLSAHAYDYLVLRVTDWLWRPLYGPAYVHQICVYNCDTLSW